MDEPVGGGAGTGLSEITLAWMMGKAKALGLAFEDDVLETYEDLDPKHCLDDFQDSWNVGWGFPRVRTIDDHASVYQLIDVVADPDLARGPAPAGAASGGAVTV